LPNSTHDAYLQLSSQRMTTRPERENHIRRVIERLRIEVAALDEGLEQILDFQDPEERDLSIATVVVNEAQDLLNRLNWRLFHIINSDLPPPHPDQPQYEIWSREISHLRPLLQPPRRHGLQRAQSSGQRSSSGVLCHRNQFVRGVRVAPPHPTQSFQLAPHELESRIRARVEVATGRRVRRRYPVDTLVEVVYESDDSDPAWRDRGDN
jgi:hypothetical protein